MAGLSVVVVSSLTKIFSYFSFLVRPLKFKMHASPIRRKQHCLFTNGMFSFHTLVCVLSFYVQSVTAHFISMSVS